MAANQTEPQDFFRVGGTLGPDTPSYVMRQADEELLRLALVGQFCYVLTSRQMGKSSLMIRTAKRLENENIRTVIVELAQIGTTSEVGAWYLSLVSQIHDQLKLGGDYQAWWETRSGLSPVQRFSDFLRQVVLEEISEKVVIFIDEIDTTLKLDFSDDFFAAIRAIHNARANDRVYERLTFVLLGVAMPSDLIKNRVRTPFNIGEGVALQEFSAEEAKVLQDRLSLVYPGKGDAIFARIYYWTGGHPYLTQKLCAASVDVGSEPWSDERVDALVKDSFFTEETSRKESNLQFIRDRIQHSRDRRQLLRVYRQIQEGKEVQDEERSVAKSRLKLYGLVKATPRGTLCARNRIYERVFDLDWVQETMPKDWARWAAVASLLAAVVTIAVVAYLFVRQQRQTASFYTAQFLNNSSPDVRIVSLAGLLSISGYEDDAQDLFFTKLSPDEQLAMLQTSKAQGLQGQVVTVVKGLYTKLDNTSQNNAVLEAMAELLQGLDQVEARNLGTEIKQCLLGRSHYAAGSYPDAIDAYDVAIGLNHKNVAVLVDRALAYTELGKYEEALADLEKAVQLDGTKQASIQQVIYNNPSLFTFLGLHRSDFQLVAAWFGTLTPTSTPTHTPTPTPTPTPEGAIVPETAREVVQLVRFGSGSVQDMAFSPDSKLLAVATSLGAYVYDAETLSEPLWSVETEAWVSSVAFSPDGSTLALGMWDNTVSLLQVSSGALLRTLEGGHTEKVTTVCFSPDGLQLASGSYDKTIILWQVEDGKKLHILPGHRDWITDVAFSPSGNLLASAAGPSDPKIRLWRVRDGEPYRTLSGHSDAISGLAFSPDGTFLASASWDMTIRLWSIEDGKEKQTLRGNSTPALDVVFSGDETALISVSQNYAVLEWPIDKRKQASLQPKLLLKEGVADVAAFSSDGTALAVFSGGAVRTRQLSDAKSSASITGYSSGVKSIDISPDGTLLSFGTWGGSVQLQQIQGDFDKTIQSARVADVNSVSFSPDGSSLASGSTDNTIRLWSVSQCITASENCGVSLNTLVDHTGSIEDLAFSPDGTMLASGSRDNTVRLWSLSQGTTIRILSDHIADVTSVAFSPDGKLLASGSVDATVRLWHIGEEILPPDLLEQPSTVLSLAFSPDGKLLASGLQDGTIKLWRLSDGILLRTLKGHGGRVWSVVFSPYGTLLASGSEDATVRLWQVSTGEEILSLEQHAYEVRAVAFSADGTLLASGSLDGSVRLWGILPSWTK